MFSQWEELDLTLYVSYHLKLIVVHLKTMRNQQKSKLTFKNYNQFHYSVVTIHDFILLKTISKGAYGKVILARKKNTSDLFALKVLDKEKMVEKNVTEYVMNERDILN